jgi:ABC-type transport system involved in multi-copper enzyme maturation permease subunit
MIWLSWRQFRAQATTAATALAVLAIALGVSGPGLVSRYDQLGLGTCHAACTSLASKFFDELRASPYAALFYAGLVLMYLVPAVMGIFWGAPLIAREFEHGTHRLAWNQSVSRTRWAAEKLGLVGLASVATAGLLSLMIGWWASPIDQALNYGQPNSGSGFPRLSPLVFAARGVAPLGYAAFAFVLGVAAGVLIRRTLPAMAVTLVIFAAVQILMPTLVRPHLIPPVTATAPLNLNDGVNELMVNSPGNRMTVVGTFSRPGAWILSNQTITPSGQAFTGPATAACTGNSSTQQTCANWLDSLHLRQLISYQPAGRFWPLQWLETAIYLVLAAGLGLLCVWQVRRRRS